MRQADERGLTAPARVCNLNLCRPANNSNSGTATTSGTRSRRCRPYAAEKPLIIAAAHGCFLIDLDGREYLDGVSSLWCNVHGHRVPEIDAAVREQLDAVAHSTLLGMSNVPAIRLARRLVELAPPGLNHVFYSDDGATAVEVALKMAFQYWRQRPDPRPGKTKFLALQGAYHGDTLGDVSVGDLARFHHLFAPLLVPDVAGAEPLLLPLPARPGAVALPDRLRRCPGVRWCATTPTNWRPS